MRVRTLQNLKTPQGEISAGQIVNIPSHVADRLKGKVEPVTDALPFQGAAEIVTREGESIWIATAPDDVELIPKGKVFFLADEIERLHKAGKEAARAALKIKQVFENGAIVTGIEKTLNNYRP
jgi:exosome complex RNA-binding protein Rrp4